MNPLLTRSRRKLDEAAFFLRRLGESDGRHPEFGYYLSAFLSAVRSVGLVLQADLRGRFGARFDKWWETAKASLPKRRIPFSVIKELRNQAVKEGEILPGMTVVVRLDHPKVEEISFTFDLQQGQIVTAQAGYKFREDAGLSLRLRNPDDSHEVLQELQRVVPELRDGFLSLDKDEPQFEVESVGYLLEKDGPAVPFEELISGLSEHIAAMRPLIEEADGLFRSA